MREHMRVVFGLVDSPKEQGRGARVIVEFLGPYPLQDVQNAYGQALGRDGLHGRLDKGAVGPTLGCQRYANVACSL